MERKKIFIGALVVLAVLAGLFLYFRYQRKPTVNLNRLEDSVTAPEGKTVTVPPEVIQKLTAPTQSVTLPSQVIEGLTAPDTSH